MEWIQKRYRKHPILTYGGIYTAGFVILALAAFGYLLFIGKTLIWEADGLSQHYTALLYYRHWLRDVVQTLIKEHTFSPTLWEWNIGYGADVIQSLSYYVIGDPLALLVGLVPKEEMVETFYGLMILLRVYLGGLAFSLYCKEREVRSKKAVMLGALFYDFTAWTVMALVHPLFLNPLIYFPLVLIGAERLIKKGRYGFYVGALAITVLSNYYFAYMICIFIGLYVLLRLHSIYWKQKDYIIKMAKMIGTFLLFSLLAIGLAAIIFVPSAMTVVNNSRTNINREVGLFYSLYYYAKLPAYFLFGSMSYSSYFGYSISGLLALSTLFVRRGKEKPLKAAIIGLIVMMCFPWFGHMFNGFSYVTNRFAFAFAFAVAFTYVKVYPEFERLSDRERYQVVGIVSVGCLASILSLVLIYGKQPSHLIIYCGIAIVHILLTWLMVLPKYGQLLRKRSIRISDSTIRSLIGSFTLLISTGILGCLWTVDLGESFLERKMPLAIVKTQALEQQIVAKEVGDVSTNQIDKVKIENTLRFDKYKLGTVNKRSESMVRNTSLATGVPAVTYFWSLTNPYLADFNREMYLNTTRDYTCYNLDRRYILDEISSVRYFFVPKGEKWAVPYGFSNYISHEGIASDQLLQADLYENSSPLPFAYVYEEQMKRDAYEAMDVTEKGQMLLQGVVWDGGSLPQAEPEFTEVDVDFKVKTGKGVRFEENTIYVDEEGGKLTLNFEGCPDSETYVIWDNLRVKANDPGISRVSIRYKAKGLKNRMSYTLDNDNFNTDYHDYLINLGYHEKDTVKSVTLTFRTPGEYRFDRLRVVHQPMAEMNAYVEKIQQCSVRNLKVSKNMVTGFARFNQPSALFFSIPYSDGWELTVNGEPVELKRANTAFMAAELPAGEYTFMLRYHSPYLRRGAKVSLASFVLLIFIGIVEKVRSRHRIPCVRC